MTKQVVSQSNVDTVIELPTLHGSTIINYFFKSKKSNLSIFSGKKSYNEDVTQVLIKSVSATKLLGVLWRDFELKIACWIIKISTSPSA